MLYYDLIQSRMPVDVITESVIYSGSIIDSRKFENVEQMLFVGR